MSTSSDDELDQAWLQTEQGIEKMFVSKDKVDQNLLYLFQIMIGGRYGIDLGRAGLKEAYEDKTTNIVE